MPDEITAIPDDTEGSAPPEGAPDATPSSSAPADRDEILSRLTQAGRDRVAAQQKAAELEARLGYTSQVVANQAQQLESIRHQMSQQQWRDFEARLAQMNPVDAANERSRVQMEYTRNLEQRLTQAQQRPAPQQQQPPQRISDEEYSRQYAETTLAEFNALHKLTGRDALTIEDMPQDAWTSERRFAAKVGEMAKQRASARSENDLSDPKTAAKLREEIKRDLIKELGAGRSMSPEASPGREEPASEDVARIAAQHQFRTGPHKSLEALRKNRESILAKMTQ